MRNELVMWWTTVGNGSWQLEQHPELEPNRRDELKDAALAAAVSYCESEQAGQ
jgi:hypothetical protein